MALASVKPLYKGDILVIDDEAELRSLLKLFLETEGYHCACAASEEEAIELFGKQRWDLVVTDMCLRENECTGLELIDYFHEHNDTIPVILITAFPSIPRAVDAMKRGAINFLPKPFDREMFLHQVNKALQERRLRVENQRLQAEINKTAVIEKLNRELDQRINELYRLYTISEGLNDFLDSRALFERIAELASDVTDSQRVAVMVLDRTRRYLRIKAAIGISEEEMARTVIKCGDGVIGRVAQRGEAVRLSQALAMKPGPRAVYGEGAQTGSASSLTMPLIIGKEVFGVLCLSHKLDGSDYTREDEQIMYSLVEKAGIRLENQALYEGIYSNLVDTLTSLVSTLEAKDPYTREHSQRVTDYAVELARFMQCDEDSIEMIQFAGMLHDIGKIGVRDEILTKCGRLTDEEYDAIKEHPLIGERIVAPLGLIAEEIAIIRHHHERWDGRGYPDGLKGEEIPPLARIVAVADAFDAMTSTRSYRRALPIETALLEMQRCSGSQFDPKIVEAWIGAIEQNAVTLQIPCFSVLSMGSEAS